MAVSLPWSTSATSILLVLWLVALLPTLDVAMMRREVETAAGGCQYYYGCSPLLGCYGRTLAGQTAFMALLAFTGCW